MDKNIIGINCPNCGARLEAPEDMTRLFCMYCGSSVMLNDARSAGYDFEVGRLKAQKNIPLHLANEIREIKEPLLLLPEMRSFYNRRNAQYKQMTKKEAKLIKRSAAGTLFVPIIISVVILLLSIICRNIFIALLGLLLVFEVYMLECCKDEAERKDVAISLKILRYQITKVTEDIQDCCQILEEHKDINIPSKYHTEEALDFFIDKLSKQGANSLEQVFSMYDEKKERDDFIRTQQAQIQIQAKQIEELKRLQQNGRRR